MLKDGKLRKVSKLRENLVTSLLSTKNADIHDEISARIGSLSTPSKMPGYSWSISATKCITGSKLALVEGTPCSKCYARRNFYLLPVVKTALDQRLQGWEEDPDWIALMAIRLLLRKDTHFRWFDSGDLQSLKMLQDICDVAEHTNGYVSHWLPTQENAFVYQLLTVPSNLTIRLSSSKIGVMQPSKYAHVQSSAVSKAPIDGEWMCPSSKQGNKCLDCRACWDKSIPNVVYLEH
jgi:hypothetical protein